MILFEKDRTCLNTSAKEQILYRLQVRSHMTTAENMFRIEYNRQSTHASIQFVAVDDLTLEEPKSLEDRWKYYVTSYSLSHPTEGISHEELQPPFLEKILEKEEEFQCENGEYSPEGVSSSNLKVKINPETYSLDVQPGSYDFFSRKSINKFPIEINNDAYKSKRGEKAKCLTSYLNGAKGWKRGLVASKVLKAQTEIEYVKTKGTLVGLESKDKNDIVKNDIDGENKSYTFSTGQLHDHEEDKPISHQEEPESKGNDTTTEEFEGEIGH